ncbi:MAG: aspartate aminotransferase family protein [Coriobacteriales bacterium]|nr:aspartate aminotransferase family protein [Coriobacteriales bacterium]
MPASLEQLQKLDAEYVMHTFARKPVAFVRGEGMRLQDDTGREYLDFVSGIGCVNLGHAHPAVTAAVCEQMGKLVHVSNLFYVEHRDEAAEQLVRLLGGGMKVFFANSGAEANEGAIKLARKWALANKPGAFGVVTAERSFHGRTMATLAATGQPSKQESFKPLPEGFSHVPLNDLDALAEAIDPTTAAVMIEVVQGEGGVWPATKQYVHGVRKLCDETNTLLIIDEVQTGFFRTGPAFAFLAFGIEPDIVTVAKAMANGLPIGALAATDSVASAFEPGDHGSTFAGGPVVCAAARATMDALIADDLGANARFIGEYLRGRLSELAASGHVAEIRGAGLMCGITLTKPVAAEAATALLERGIVVNSIGTDILRFLPPLVCGRAEVDTLLSALADVLAEVSS